MLPAILLPRNQNMNRSFCAYKTSWPLRTPIRITGHVFEKIDMVVVEIGQDGHTGRGEGCGVYYTNDFADGMLEQIELVRGDILAGMTREELQSALPPGGARNALDCALWDLDARLDGRGVWDMLSISPDPVRTAFTISINSAEEMARQAAKAADYSLIKIKLDAETPVERVAAIRAARPDATLIIDANEGFSFAQLRRTADALADLGVAMIEQPLPRGGDSELEGYKSPVPLCADESCLHRGELSQALERYDMINIKLDKTGGLTEALALAAEARKAGKALMVGNMVGTSLSMAPAFAIAQLCEFADLDGPLALRSDLVNGLVYRKGMVGPPAPEFWGGPLAPRRLAASHPPETTH
ncbi:mandelate racemase/muconate lactonizing enzyme family protein [Hyphomonas neptunium ATCC 15444]|uniref:Dipeptide epimerase n=1 Tax=Hyphomonas neptunium (strain ATCC 15444) TaxID=228405 RepID=Q0C1S5_HYPNA|nr:mandelate racemase/muconate lactonizing enzyme family protein [Hyphomonas neptunium ATCC 15444]